MAAEEHLPDDLLPGQAPFEVFGAEGQHWALLKIAAATKGTADVSYDPWPGIISLRFEWAVEPHDIHPWMLLLDADRGRVLEPIPAERRDRVASAILAVWQRMVEELNLAVAVDRMLVVAREDSPLARHLTVLPNGAWASFDMIDWEHGAAVCRHSGAKLFDVRFRPTMKPDLAGMAALDGANRHDSCGALSDRRNSVEPIQRAAAKKVAVVDACSGVWKDRNAMRRVPRKEQREAIRRWWKDNDGPSTMSDDRMNKAIRDYLGE